MDKMEMFIDKFGRGWRLPKKELCPKCEQPDNCGNCNCIKLPENIVRDMGGVIFPNPFFRKEVRKNVHKY